MTFPTWLVQSFSAGVRQAGRGIAARAEVTVSESSTRFVLAVARDRTPIGVQLERRGPVLAANCGCPAFRSAKCEHLWALLCILEGRPGPKIWEGTSTLLGMAELDEIEAMEFDDGWVDDEEDDGWDDLDDWDDHLFPEEPEASDGHVADGAGDFELVADPVAYLTEVMASRLATGHPEEVSVLTLDDQDVLTVAPEFAARLVALGRASLVVPRRVPARILWEDALDWVDRQLPARQPPHYALGTRVTFVLDPALTKRRNNIAICAFRQERLKRGGWSKPRQLTRDLRRLELEAADLALLRRLSDTDTLEIFPSGPRRVFHPDGPAVPQLLRDLAATGRLLLGDVTAPEDATPLTADEGPAWTLELEVLPVEGRPAAAETAAPAPHEGRERASGVVATHTDISPTPLALRGALVRGEERAEIADVQLSLRAGFLALDGRFMALDVDAFPWFALLKSAGEIELPREALAELLTRIGEQPSSPRLRLHPGTGWRLRALPPRPQLTVHANPRARSLEASVHFLYDELAVEAADWHSALVVPSERLLLPRNFAAEQAFVEQLLALGATPCPGTRAADRPASEPLVTVRTKILPDLVPALLGAGWRVLAEGQLHRPAGTISLRVRSGLDWLDLDGQADFEGRAVPLPTLLRALRRGERTVPLDDGSVGLLPEAWLARLGVFAQLGEVKGQHLRFRPSQAQLLDLLLADQPHVDIDATFARLRDELRSFEGIVPEDPPSAFAGALRGYQREALGWFRFLRRVGLGGCLADDMGLGKTVQVLALLSGLAAERQGRSHRGEPGAVTDGASGAPPAPSLIVVPRSLVSNWRAEAARFAPGLRLLVHTGPGRSTDAADLAHHDVVLTTYGVLIRDARMLAGQRFDTVVLDESQTIKNPNTVTAKAARLLQADHRLALSGTPIENHLGELWSLFEFLNPGMLGRSKVFAAALGAAAPGDESLALIARAVRPFVLRRTKDQVASDLPQRTELTLLCDLEEEERTLYDELAAHYRQALLPQTRNGGLGGKGRIQILEALLRLRQAACHPGLVHPRRYGDRSSAKLDVLIDQVSEVVQAGHKALVFSQFTRLLGMVRAQLDARAIAYEYLDGRTRRRGPKIERFQTDPSCPVFLISLKAGGLGLNLTAAEYVFLLDPWWNPASEAQAIDRAHRIGQARPVFAYRLIARDTVEEKVIALQAQKRALADAIITADNRLLKDLGAEDLELLLS